MKKIISKLLAFFNLKISKNTTREDNAFSDQKHLMNTNDEMIVFDVGAYHGETVLRYHNLFKNNCQIFAFEAFPSTFEVLKKKLHNYSNIQLYNFALGGQNGRSLFSSNKFSGTNSLLNTSDKAKATWGSDIADTVEKIQVPVQTIDAFCLEMNVTRIDILKMDTQGAEFMVLEGAKNTLSEKRIKVIYTEIILGSTYEGQKELYEFLRIMKENGFELYNLYPAYKKQSQLKYMDALFILKDTI